MRNLLQQILLICLFPTKAVFSAAAFRNRGTSHPPQTRHSYDRSVTTFSPSGELLQVDYSRAATERSSGTLLAAIYHESILLLRKIQSNKDVPTAKTSLPLFPLSNNLFYVAAPGSLSGDVTFLVRHVRQYLAEYTMQYGEEVPTMTEIAQYISKIHHQFTITAGFRPLACRGWLMGYDIASSKQARIVQVDLGIEDVWYTCSSEPELQKMDGIYQEHITKADSLEEAIQGLQKIVGINEKAEKRELVIISPEGVVER